MTSEHDPQDAQYAEGRDISDGLAPGALPVIRRELFMDALAVARHDHDPGTQWEQFCEAAWKEAALEALGRRSRDC